MKTQYYTASSLDGFIATSDDSLEWLFPLGDVETTSYPTFIRDVGALAMGSTTYEWMLKHVIGPEAKQRQPWPYTQPAWVFSSRTRAHDRGALPAAMLEWRGGLHCSRPETHRAHRWSGGSGEKPGSKPRERSRRCSGSAVGPGRRMPSLTSCGRNS